MKAPRLFWQLIRIGPRLAYAIGLGPIIGRFVLLLTTRGCKSGRTRVTPLVYEEVDGTYLVASARGPAADWLRNIRADPNVMLRVGRRRIDGLAELVSDPQAIAAYIRRQMERHPRMFGTILRLEGLPPSPTLDQLEGLAASRPMVAIRPKYH